MLNFRAIPLATAKETIRKKCRETPQTWLDSAMWFVCTLEAEDFQKLLVFNGGRPYSGWQEFVAGSYEINDVAAGLQE